VHCIVNVKLSLSLSDSFCIQSFARWQLIAPLCLGLTTLRDDAFKIARSRLCYPRRYSRRREYCVQSRLSVCLSAL